MSKVVREKKSRTSYNEVTKNLNSDKFAAYLVRLLYLYMKAVCFLLQNMNYIERVVRVVFFLTYAFLLHYLSLPPYKIWKWWAKLFLFDKVQTEKTEAEKSDASKRIW